MRFAWHGICTVTSERMQCMSGLWDRGFGSGFTPDLNVPVRPAFQNIFTIAGNRSEKNNGACRPPERLHRYDSRCCTVKTLAGLAWLSSSLMPASAQRTRCEKPTEDEHTVYCFSVLPVADDLVGSRNSRRQRLRVASVGNAFSQRAIHFDLKRAGAKA